MKYNFSEWKNYRNVPRFVKEYARWKINNLINNQDLDADSVNISIEKIFDRIKKLEYCMISVDECISIIETIAFNVDIERK